MAARIRKIRHDDETRAKIQTSQLANRLMAHAFGDIELSPTQVQAIKILLGKTLPDLTAIEMNAEVQHSYELRETVPTADEWERDYATEH